MSMRVRPGPAARWVTFENLRANGLMSDNTLWARTVCVCAFSCVLVCAKCALWSEFLFLGGGLRFSDGKNCIEIYFAAFPSVLAGFTHLPGFWQFALHLALPRTHTHTLINTPTNNVNSAFVCCFSPASVPRQARIGHRFPLMPDSPRRWLYPHRIYWFAQHLRKWISYRNVDVICCRYVTYKTNYISWE